MILVESVDGCKRIKIKIITPKLKPCNFLDFENLNTWSMVSKNVCPLSFLAESVDRYKHMKIKGLNQEW